MQRIRRFLRCDGAACWQHRGLARDVLIFPATLCLGGVLFSWLEHQSYEEQEARLLDFLQRMNGSLGRTEYEELLDWMGRDSLRTETDVLALQQGQLHETYSNPFDWAGATFWCFTAVTTIGCGNCTPTNAQCMRCMRTTRVLHAHGTRTACALHVHRYGVYTPLTEAGRLVSIFFAAVGISICFRACAQLARWLLSHLVVFLYGRPSTEDRGVRTLLALAVWALLQARQMDGVVVDRWIRRS